MGGEGGRGRGAWLPSSLRTRRGHTGASGLCGETGEASQHEQPQVIGPHRTQTGVGLSITNNSDYVCWPALAVYALLAASVSLPMAKPRRSSASAAGRGRERELSRHRVTFSCHIGRMKTATCPHPRGLGARPVSPGPSVTPQ